MIQTPEWYNASVLVDRNLEAGRADKVAIFYGAEEVTYGELARRINRFGHALRGMGVDREDRVLLMLNDTPSFPTAFFAAMRIGAVPIPANTLLEQAMLTRPRLSGRLDGQVFDDFCDSDAILGPFLEVFLQSDYVWFPLEQIKQLTIPPPTHLRDLLWTPAGLEAHSGPVGDVFLPVLYPGSCQHGDDRIKLGRLTDWLDGGGGLVRGVGQHLFLVGEDGRQSGGVVRVQVCAEAEVPNRGDHLVGIRVLDGDRPALSPADLHLAALGSTSADDDVTAFFSPHAAGKSFMFVAVFGVKKKRAS